MRVLTGNPATKSRGRGAKGCARGRGGRGHDGSRGRLDPVLRPLGLCFRQFQLCLSAGDFGATLSSAIPRWRAKLTLPIFALPGAAATGPCAKYAQRLKPGIGAHYF